jgi:hypothetical protein
MSPVTYCLDHDPKSQAGRRRVSFPQEIAAELRWHLECFAQPGDDGLVFIGPRGGRLRRADLPARHPGSGRGHRGGHGQAAQAGPAQEGGRENGHATGTRPQASILTAISK